MGKKVKKKSRVAPKEKRAAQSAVVVPQQCSPSVEAADGVSVMSEKRSCPHVGKGFDLSILSEKFGSSEPVRCEDCREGAVDRRGSKGKGKHGKKKGSALDSKSESKAIWVCLECGHFACGGIGLPTTPQSHAVRHARQTRHPITIQLENPHLRWCFPCSTLIPVEKMEENGEPKDVFSDVVKLIKGRSSEGSAVDAVEVWFGGGSVTSELKLADTQPSGLQGKGGYVVRGLVNLGNTCFFNSVMQNLLAMDALRDYFLKLDPNFGLLTIALKKVFAETNSEAGLKNVINPRSFFGCVCSKAPQFRGYQQHDSHELLRCLLDGLSTEELGAKKQISSSQDNGSSTNHGPTFVDTVFGGKISSTVRCLECGHSSTVYEPFLDLSLPVPTKKPPSKKAQPVFRGKKPKLPPKRSGRVRQKVKKDADSLSTQCVPSPLAISESSSVAESSHSLAPLSDSTQSNVYGPTHIADESSSVSQSFPAGRESENEQVVEKTTEHTSALLDSFTWMDYLEPETMSDEQDPATENIDSLVIEDSGVKDDTQNDAPAQGSFESDTQVCSLNRDPNLGPNSSSVNPLEDELPLVLVQDSSVLLLPYKEETSITGEVVREEVEVSSLAAGCEQEQLDFDGIGDLFNEPEVVAGPMPRPSLGDDFLQSNEAETSFLSVNISESDPDEVDNSNSPVSVESCLAHFIKPECLSNDNAWHCENCSKILLRQRLKVKKGNCSSQIAINGSELKSQTIRKLTEATIVESNPQSLTKDISCAIEVSTLSNGDMKSDDAANSSSKCSISQNGKVDCMNPSCTTTGTDKMGELDPVVSPEEGKGQIEDAQPEQSHSSDSNDACYQAIVSHHAGSSPDEPCISGNNMDEVQHHASELMAVESEPDEVEDDVIDSKSVKVMRDATKRVLIDKAPPILTIHLKRFSQDARGRLSKLNGHVKFGETIDLRPYMDPRCMDNEKFDYSLIGVVEHSGTMRGGHYVAYVKGGEKSKGKAENKNGGCVWYNASDIYVRQVSLEEVLGCEAYILFYERN